MVSYQLNVSCSGCWTSRGTTEQRTTGAQSWAAPWQESNLSNSQTVTLINENSGTCQLLYSSNFWLLIHKSAESLKIPHLHECKLQPHCKQENLVWQNSCRNFMTLKVFLIVAILCADILQSASFYAQDAQSNTHIYFFSILIIPHQLCSQTYHTLWTNGLYIQFATLITTVRSEARK